MIILSYFNYAIDFISISMGILFVPFTLNINNQQLDESDEPTKKWAGERVRETNEQHFERHAIDEHMHTLHTDKHTHTKWG